MSKLYPARLVSEPSRERETFKYDPTLLTSIKYNATGTPIASCDLTTSPDSVLTAFCQLGTLRCHTARSLISLFDKEWQYIVAEATPTISLVPSLGHPDLGHEDLWLCNSAIPRHHGVCDYALCVFEPDGPPGAHDSNMLPVAVVSDLTTDPRFSIKPYCRPGAPARFYAGVPIRTHRGINIGVYCVIDTEPRELSTWDEKDSEVLLNISSSIMHHLELRRSNHILSRSDRMTRGLASFLERRDVLPAHRDDIRVPQQPSPVAPQDPLTTCHDQPSYDKNKLVCPRKAVHTHPGQEHARLQVVPETDSELPGVSDRNVDMLRTPPSALPLHNSAPPAHSADTDSTPPAPDTIYSIFARAANIIRDVIDVDGVLYVDANLGGSRSHPSGSSEPDSDDDSAGHNSDSRSAKRGAKRKRSATSSVEELSCRVLGISQKLDAARSVQDMPIRQSALARLLRRYPRGKVFTFGDSGELQSSDSSGDESTPRRQRTGPLNRTNDGVARRQHVPNKGPDTGRTMIGTSLGARGVAFIPVWDARKSRWFAGGFAYTNDTTRILTMEGDLSYIRAFGMLIMEEFFQIETQRADKAKSDLLDSLSHELRSPLHGIVLGIELFHDTGPDVFQRNIMHTLETCSRTLLDTVDHLLDFSKVNNCNARRKVRKQTTGVKGSRSDLRQSFEPGPKSLNSPVKLDVLLEEVMESVFAGFNFQYLALSQLAQQGSSTHSDVNANRRLDSMRAMEELGPGLDDRGEIKVDFGNVSVLLDIDPLRSWSFQTQPGAFRRIVMNLFGNSLKYTHAGTITVSAMQAGTENRPPGEARVIQLAVRDTGKGISEDYLRHEIFKPFSQEDQLAPGTGLGLSLVKQITAQMKGTISVESRIGVGTTVLVSLPLLPVMVSSKSEDLASEQEEKEFANALSDLRRRVLYLIDPGSPKKGDDVRSIGAVQSHKLVEKICRGWFGMEVISQSQILDGRTADISLCLEEDVDKVPVIDAGGAAPALPAVVICQNALASFRRSSSVAGARGGAFEVISHPIGPRKLARALSSALARWQDLPADTTKPAIPCTLSVPSKDPSVGQSNRSTVESSMDLVKGTTIPAPLTTPTGRDEPVTDVAVNSRAFLLVDDNQINLKILAAYVKKIGRRYTTATNGLEATHEFCRHADQYACVFMDISMPVMDGFEATRQIRAHERRTGIPPIAIFGISGLASASAQQEAFESGIDLFLTKPVMLKELGTILDVRGLL